MIVILPFISLYTKDVNDINYMNDAIAILLAVILFLEVVHLPAGNIINISGNFKAARNIQIIVCILLVLSLSILGYLFGIYGILIGTIITNIVLASLEIKYTHINIFKSNLFDFIKKLIVNVALMFFVIILGRNILLQIDSYLLFLVCGFITLLLCTTTVIFINYLFFKNDILKLKELIINMKNKFIKKVL